MTRIEETYVNDYYKITEDEKISEILEKIKIDYEEYVSEYTQFFNFFLLGY